MRKLFRMSLFVLMVLCGFGLSGATSPNPFASGLKLTKEAPHTVDYGANITYKLTCFNDGDEAAREVKIDDTLPNGVKFVAKSASRGGSVAGNTLTFKIPTLPAGGSVTISYQVRIPDAPLAGITIKSGGALVTARNFASAAAAAVSTAITTKLKATDTGPGKIVFLSVLPNGANFELFLMNSDGSGLTQITFDANKAFNTPILSPDGSKIAYLASGAPDFKYHLYVINAAPVSDTNQPLQLTNPDGADPVAGDYPSWSPNGRQIVYSRGGVPYITDLTPQSTTHQPVVLTNTGSGMQFAFSPDGKQLAYDYFAGGTIYNIATIALTTDSAGNVTGSTDSAHVRTSSTRSQYSPTWSPDGTKIAFVQDDGTGSAEGELWTVTPPSLTATQLTSGQQVSFRNISWSPDGTLITYGGRSEGRATDGTIFNGGVDGVYTIKPVPETGSTGSNYPNVLTSITTQSSYDPSFAQVSGGGGTSPTPTPTVTPTPTPTPTVTPTPTPTTAPTSPVTLSKAIIRVNGHSAGATTALAPGDEVVYLFKIANSSNDAATNVVVTDPLPTTLTGKSATFSDDGGTPVTGVNFGTVAFDSTSNTATFSLSRFVAGGLVFGTVTAKVHDLTNGTSVTNTATLTADNLPTVSSSATSIVNATATMTLSKSVYSINGIATTTNQTVIPGDSILYVLRYANTGNGVATSVHITDPLPVNTRSNGVYFSDFTGKQIDAPTGGSVNLTASEGTASYDIPSVAPGAVGYITLVAVVKSDAAAKAKQISNVNYTLTADGGINLTGLPAVTNPLRAPINISKRVQLVNGKPYNPLTPQVRVGDVLTYQIDINNPTGNGAAAAKNLVVSDFLPQGTTIDSAGTGTYVAATPPYVQFKFSSLAVGDAKTMTFSVKVGASVSDHVANVDYGLTLDGYNRRFTGTEVDTPVASTTVSQFTVSKTAKVIENGSSTQVAPGQNIRYVLTVTNGGTDTLTDVTVNDTLPVSTIYNRAYLGTPDAPVTGTAPTYNASSGVVKYSIPRLAPKSSDSMTLEVQVQFGATAKSISNSTYSASAPGFSATGTPISLTLVKSGGPAAPNLQISKTASVGGQIVKKVTPGDTLVYTFSYSNSSTGKTTASTARGAYVTETLPLVKTATGTTLPAIVSSSLNYTSDSNGHLVWTLGDLGNGASGSFTLTLKVPTAAKPDSQIVNSAYEIDAANIAGVGAKGDSVSLTVAAVKLPSLLVLVGANVDDNQKTNGKLHAGSKIDYTIAVRNNGDGTATNITLVDLLPDGANYVENSASFDTSASNIPPGQISIGRDDSGRATGLLIATSDLVKRGLFAIHFSVVVSATAPATLTQIENYATLGARDTLGNAISVKSNVDDEPVAIAAPTPTPVPKPANLTLAYGNERPFEVARNTAFTTTIMVSNTGGQAAHNILLRYNFNPVAEQVTSASEGGQKTGVSNVLTSVVWDGTGSSQASKFATLNPGDVIAVQVTVKSSNRLNQTLITGEVTDVHERSSATSHGKITNPVYRQNLPDIPVVNSLAATSLTATSPVTKLSESSLVRQESIFDVLGQILSSIGKALSSIGAQNVPAPVREKLAKTDLSKSRTSGSAGEDHLVITEANGDTLKIVPLVAGVSYRVEGASGNIVAQGGGNIVAQGGGNIVAQGGGNISVATPSGFLTISQLLSKVISNDGGTLQSVVLYKGGNGTLISQDGNGLISQDGNSLTVPFPASLIGQDGNGLIGQDGNGLIGQDGNGLVAKIDTQFFAKDGNALVNTNGSNLVGPSGGTLAPTNLQGTNLLSNSPRNPS